MVIVQQDRTPFKYLCSGVLRFILWCPLSLVSLIILESTVSHAQVIGEEAEMTRLEEKAENAMAMGDPNGATLSIGKAALMASLLAKKETDPQARQVYDGAEALFRAQENGYRALALFEQAGGELPSPSGVCQLLELAQIDGNTATQKLAQQPTSNQTASVELHERFSAKTQEWLQIIEELQTDFSCI